LNSRIKEKIKEIEQFVSDLESIVPTDFEEYKTDAKTKAACERFFEKIVEGIVVVAFLVIKEKGLKMPEEDKESFGILADARIISFELAIRLKQAKGMRNILAHDYGRVDDELVFESITNEIVHDANAFLEKIKRQK
jgi:uncharacterized protein YutE (UPF0331/DUF86 family)